jgi:ACS family hexuronate transporter-like MFS transporter
MAKKAKFVSVARAGSASLAAVSLAISEREKARHEAIVVGLLFLSTLINYLDRQTLSIVAPLLRDQFSLSNVDYSHIVFAFLLGYTLSQILVGKLIDRVGTRAGMLMCVAVWSAATIVHGLALGFVSFCLARFFLGIAEAGNWPGAVKAISENFPPQRYALAAGIFNSGSFFGAIIAAPLIAALVQTWGWRWMFAAIGVTGFTWICMWTKFYKNRSPVPLQKCARMDRRPFLTVTYLRQKTIWGLMIARFLADPVWWLYVFWLPEYLVRSRGFDLPTIGRVLWIPFLFAALGSGMGGYASGALVDRWGSAALARKVVAVLGAALMLLGIMPAFLASNNTVVVVWVSLILFGYASWAANVLSLAADLFPSEQVARVTGLLGTAGAIGGMLFTLTTGWLVQNVSYGPVFALASAMIVCAASAIVWLVPREMTTELPAI